MTRMISLLAALAGVAVIGWTGTAFIGQNTLALGVTLSIAAVFLVGCFEMWRYQYGTLSLSSALDRASEPVENLDHWLEAVDSSLRDAVRLRIRGDQVGLPVPALTPYLTGLLVMLGLLGTFIGMVDMLSGAVKALRGTADLEAIRAGLAAPISGLGLAFGTSVAGVAASAALGLIATLGRRDRVSASRYLDRKINKVFGNYSLTQKREKTFDVMQSQALLIPDVTERLAGLSDHLERFCEDLGGRLLDNQQAFNESVDRHFTGLTESVSQALKENLNENVRCATESVEPALSALSRQVGDQLQDTQQILADAVKAQVDQVGLQLAEFGGVLSANWQSGLVAQQQANEALISRSLEQVSDVSSAVVERTAEASAATVAQMTELLASSQAMVEARAVAESEWLGAQASRFDALGGRLQQQFSSLRDEESQRGERAEKRLQDFELIISEHLLNLTQSLEAPMNRLLESASVAPKAAAEVIAQMRREVSQSVERDNQLLTECTSILSDLSGLRESWSASADVQARAIETLVSESSETLTQGVEQMIRHSETESDRLLLLSEQMTASSAEITTLGETFSVAVGHYGDANQHLVENLMKIDQALQANAHRSDEQMQYYVAQAREIIDHTMLSHQQLMDQLRAMTRRTDAVVEA
jgi:hypothetical protein